MQEVRQKGTTLQTSLDQLSKRAASDEHQLSPKSKLSHPYPKS
jgi:hypothetical protein